MVEERRKTAIVVGATGGIGAAIAKYLSEEEYHVLLIARNKDKLKSLAEKLGDNISYVSADVIDTEKVINIVQVYIEKKGHIDLLFNSAGYVKRGTSDLIVNEFKKMIDINLVGVFNWINAVVPFMKEQQSGKIVTVSSYSGKIARAPLGGYAASKFGVMGLSESLYKELAPFNISVTAICPNLVDTPMTADVNMPRELMISPNDVVKALEFLLGLSSAVSIKEIVMQCRARLIENESV